MSGYSENVNRYSVQKFRGSEVQRFRSSEVQRFRSSEVNFCDKGRIVPGRFLPVGRNNNAFCFEERNVSQALGVLRVTAPRV